MLGHSFNKVQASGENKFQFHLKHFMLFTILFYLSIIIGTISHEFGHIIVAKSLGYDVKLDYHSMDWYIKDKIDFVKPIQHDILITLGGILMTIGISLISFYMVLKQKLIDTQFWLLLFGSLFISRQLINLMMSIIGKLFLNETSYYGGDELALSQMLHWHDGFFSLATALLALFICYLIVFKILPKAYFVSFMASAMVGGSSGYYLWFYKIGPFILPSI